jgi:hypothetical protein
VVVVTATRGGGDSARDSQTEEGKKYVAAMMASSDAETFSADEATCIAEGSVDIIGVKTLQDAGVTPDDMANSSDSDLLPGFKPTEQQANAILDLMFGCVDFGTMFAEGMVGSGVDLPSEKMHCVGDQLEASPAFRAFLVSTMLNPDTDTTDPSEGGGVEAAMLEIFTKCGVSTTDLGG